MVDRRLGIGRDRIYTQLSHKIELGQSTFTNPDDIRAAYELGVKDGETFVKGSSMSSLVLAALAPNICCVCNVNVENESTLEHPSRWLQAFP
jgi:hypothetical protein